MRAQPFFRGVLLFAVGLGLSGLAHADPTPQTASGLPPQIVPSAPEVGLTIMQMPGSGNNTTGAGSTGNTSPGGSGSAYADMMDTSYGAAAVTDAQTAGISADALAAIGETE